MAKVLRQRQNKQHSFMDIVGECERCGAFVHKNQYGKDEYCPQCNAELDWSEEQA